MGSAEACRFGEVVFLAIPHEGNRELLDNLRQDLRGKVVVDLSNPLNETMTGLTIPPDTSVLEGIAALLPESRPSADGTGRFFLPDVLMSWRAVKI